MSPPTADLPPILIGTKYRTYKRATEKLASWLSITATNLKGEGGCNSTSSNDGSFSIAQFSVLADRIVEAVPRVEIPVDILETAEKAYTFRLERNKLLKGVDLESDKRHQHVISVLGDVYQKLKSHLQASVSMKNAETPSKRDNDKGCDRSSEKDKGKDELAPSFHLLNLEPVESDSGGESGDGGGGSENRRHLPKLRRKKKMPPKKKKKVKAQARNARFVNKDEDEDPYFVLMCLLSDLKSMREYLKTVWQEYKEGKVDLITASLTTNAAFDIIKTYLEDFPAMSSLLSDYTKTMEMIMLRNVDKSQKDELMLVFSITMPFGSQVDDIVSLGKALAKMQEVADLTCAPAFYFLAGPRDMFFSTLGDRLLILNEYDSYGEYDPDLDRSKLSAAKRFREDVQLLNYFAHGFYGVEEMHHSIGMTLDHITLEWQDRPDIDVKSDHTFSLAQSLSAQIVLDIHHVLRRDAYRPFVQLYDFAKKINLSIARWKKETSNDLFKAKYRFRERALQLEQNMNMVQDTVRRIMSSYESSFGTADKPKPRRKSGDLLRSTYMALNPVLCGTMLFQLVTVVRDCGAMTAAFWKSIQSAGQLYYSCQMHRQFAKTAEEFSSDGADIRLDCKTPLVWDDMEVLFEKYGREAFFQGHLPQSNRDMIKYVGNDEDYITALGQIKKVAIDTNVSKGFAAFIKDNMNHLGKERGIGSYEPFNVTHTLHFFKYSILCTTESGRVLTGVSQWKLETLQTLLEEQLEKDAKVEASMTNEVAGKEKNRKRTTLKEEDGSMTQVTILRTLKETLHSESRIFHFDFLSFHLTCLVLLRTVRFMGLPTLESLNGGKISCKDSYTGDEDFPDKMSDIITIIHQPEAIPLQGPHSANKGHVVIDAAIRRHLEVNKCKDRQVKKIDGIWGISPS